MSTTRNAMADGVFGRLNLGRLGRYHWLLRCVGLLSVDFTCDGCSGPEWKLVTAYSRRGWRDRTMMLNYVRYSAVAKLK